MICKGWKFLINLLCYANDHFIHGCVISHANFNSKPLKKVKKGRVWYPYQFFWDQFQKNKTRNFFTVLSV